MTRWWLRPGARWAGPVSVGSRRLVGSLLVGSLLLGSVLVGSLGALLVRPPVVRSPAADSVLVAPELAGSVPLAPPGSSPVPDVDGAGGGRGAGGQGAGDEAAVPAAGYHWPLAGAPVVTRPFAPPARRWLPGHRGVDLAGSTGAVIRAAGAGVVRFAGPVAGPGVVSIDHAGGLRTTYQPVHPTVTAGQSVSAGDPIGVLDAGHAGCAVAACLHWGLRYGEDYLDPLALLGLGRVRLLPNPPPVPTRPG